MKCPKCSGALTPVTYGRKTILHRCEDCAGIFCKPDALSGVTRDWMLDVVDAGPHKLAQKHNAIEDIDCPDCGVPMDKTYDAEQPHIWFEQCAQCEGLYFDAGEFSDTQRKTFLDRLRDWWVSQRPQAKPTNLRD